MRNQDRDALAHLLSRCTVRLVVKGTGGTGTGFFVAPGYLLTCAHVVKTNKGQETIEALWNGKPYSATIQQITDDGYPDLALLRVDNLTDHPCVYLFDEIGLNDNLYAYGYPPKYPSGDSIISRYVGLTGEPQVLLTFTESNVRPGFSGSPLLNLRTGAVCGLVKLTSGESTLLGGRGIPIAQALRAFPQIKGPHEQFHRENHEWARRLTPQQRQTNGLGKLTPQTEPVTLFFSYHANKKDAKWVEKLQKQLVIWQRNGVINAWHIGELEAGEEWKSLSRQRLDSAQVILLLVSPDYIADEDLYNTHVGRAMERRAAGEARVIPVLLRPTAGWEETSFGGLWAVPDKDKPLSRWPDDDEATLKTAEKIIQVVEGLRERGS
jgi:hypothetical protein